MVSKKEGIEFERTHTTDELVNINKKTLISQDLAQEIVNKYEETFDMVWRKVVKNQRFFEVITSIWCYFFIQNIKISTHKRFSSSIRLSPSMQSHL